MSKERKLILIVKNRECHIMLEDGRVLEVLKTVKELKDYFGFFVLLMDE